MQTLNQNQNQNHYYLKDIYCRDFIDKDGILLGQVEDIVLNANTLELKTVLIFEPLSMREFILIDFSSIEFNSMDNYKGKIVSRITRKTISPVRKGDIELGSDEIYFSSLKKMNIIDKFGKVLNQKINDVLHKKDEDYVLITNKGNFITETFVRSIGSYMTIILSEKQLNKWIKNKNTKLDQLKNSNYLNPDLKLIEAVLESSNSFDTGSILASFISNPKISEEVKLNIEFFIAKINVYQGNFSKSLEMFAIISNNTKGDLHGKSKLEMGKLAFTMGDYKKSFEIFTEVIDFFSTKPNNNDILLSLSYNWLGLAYVNLGDVNKAFEFFQKGKDHAVKNNDISIIAFSQNNIGKIITKQGKFYNAISLFEDSIDNIKDSSIRMLSLLTKNQASAYFETGNQGKALELHFNALAIRRKFGNILEICESLVEIGRVEHSLGNFNENSICFKFFPLGPYSEDLKILESYKLFLNGLIEQTNKNYSNAVDLFGKSLKTGKLGLEFQVYVFEYLVEVLILLWIENDYNEEMFTEIISKVKLGSKLTEKNYLVSYHCKTIIGLAKLCMYNKDYDSAIKNYNLALKIAKDNNLNYHKKIIEIDLSIFEFNKEQFTTKIDEELFVFKEKWANELVFVLRNLRINNLF